LEKEAVESTVKDLLEKGCIQPSNSPYGAPMLLIKKPNTDELRPVFDYREINKITIKNRFPLPRIDDLYDAFGGASVFSTMDLIAGYNQFKLQESDIPKTAFTCHLGSYEWKVLSLGLCNAPSQFSKAMSEVLKPYLNKFALVYLDDICVISKTYEEHLIHLRLILDRLRESGLFAKLSKCQFMHTEIKFLGHILSDEGIRPDPVKLQVLQD
jgi:hypothetical protein